MAKSTSKRQKPTVVEDRISNLPGSLLCHIFSFLTTKEAVLTSILSSSWKTLWTPVPELNLESIELEEQSPNQQHNQDQLNRHSFTFTHMVSSVWAIRNLNNANPLKHFRLHRCPDSDPVHVETWVCTALTPDLEELDLLIRPPKPFNLSSTLFNYAKSLQVSKLKGKIVINTSSLMGFQCLKTLLLENVSCPVLQNMSLQTTKWDNNDTTKIIVPTLKRLRLSRFTLHKYDKLEINAPALEYLHSRAM